MKDSKMFRFLTFLLALTALPSIAFIIIIYSANLSDANALSTVRTVTAPIFIVVLAAALICGGVFIPKAKKVIWHFLDQTEHMANELGDGKLNITMLEEDNADTQKVVIAVNDSFKEITSAVGELIRLLDELAEGDLTVTSDYVFKSDWGELSVALTKVINNLNIIFNKIRNASDQTTSGADQVASAAQALAQGATEQASSIEELSATITEISEHIKNNAANAAKADEASQDEKKKLEDAASEMEQMTQAMAEISETSQKISNIIKTIDDIAFQTNILALNAAVEAARAGAAGKGFAVVADEVRNLASKSAEAAKDTTELIESAIKAVNNGSKVVAKTETTINEVMEAGDNAGKLVNAISQATSQQATSISQITEGIQQISSVVQTNSATAEESAAASEELAAQAKELKKTIEWIKIRTSSQAESSPTSALRVADDNNAITSKESSTAAVAKQFNEKYI
jgi:methyl-accepting chemotaxis protein